MKYKENELIYTPNGMGIYRDTIDDELIVEHQRLDSNEHVRDYLDKYNKDLIDYYNERE